MTFGTSWGADAMDYAAKYGIGDVIDRLNAEHNADMHNLTLDILTVIPQNSDEAKRIRAFRACFPKRDWSELWWKKTTEVERQTITYGVHHKESVKDIAEATGHTKKWVRDRVNRNPKLRPVYHRNIPYIRHKARVSNRSLVED